MQQLGLINILLIFKLNLALGHINWLLVFRGGNWSLLLAITRASLGWLPALLLHLGDDL